MALFMEHHHWTPTDFFSMTVKQLVSFNEHLGKRAKDAAISNAKRIAMEAAKGRMMNMKKI